MTRPEFLGPPTKAEARFGWVIPSALAIVAVSPCEPRDVGSAAILRGNIPDFFEHAAASNSISFVLAGRSRVEWRRGRRLSRFVAVPGTFSISPCDGQSAFCTGQPLESLNLAISPTQLHAVADREFRPYSGTVELLPVPRSNSAEIVGLGQAFAALMRSPRPGSRLYAETLWTQIAVQLLWGFSNLPRHGLDISGRLSDARFRRVIDFIESSLGDDISLPDLAEIAGLSPNHFLNAFKKATGKSPHQYLRERRIHRACELLHNPSMTILSVALAVGFTSHSHFSTVFTRLMKLTPSGYRRQALGVTRNLP